MNADRAVLHLVRGGTLPRDLRESGPGDTIVFLGSLPPDPLPPARLLVLGSGSDATPGIGPGALLELIFESDSVVTW